MRVAATRLGWARGKRGAASRSFVRDRRRHTGICRGPVRLNGACNERRTTLPGHRRASPPSGSGSVACSPTATRSRRPRTAREALELISFDDFDVAIVELAAANGRDALTGLRRDPGAAQGEPAASGSSPTAPAPQRHAASEAIDAGATAYVAKSSPAGELTRAVDVGRRLGDLRRPGGSQRENGGLRPDPPPARDPAALRQRRSRPQTAAKRLGLSTETVRTHTKAVLSRLEARDRTRHAVADRPPRTPGSSTESAA